MGFQQMTGKNLSVKTICVRDLDKPRDFTIPEGCKITTKFDDILGDDSLDIVVEVMGGTTLANDVVTKALESGKDVVTANKALIAEKLGDIESLVAKVNEGKEGP